MLKIQKISQLLNVVCGVQKPLWDKYTETILEVVLEWPSQFIYLKHVGKNSTIGNSNN